MISEIVKGLETAAFSVQTQSRPKLDFLDCLKAVAERAKLDSDGFWLHKFRATFATRRGKKNVCLPTLEVLSNGFGISVSELMKGV